MNIIRRNASRAASAAFLIAPLATLAALGLAAPRAAHAQTSAVTLSGGIVERAADEGGTSFVLGYMFTVTGGAPIALTSLGFYDDNNTAAAGTAMSQTHRVGIYSATGDLLVQAAVAPTDAAYAAFNGRAATAAQSATDGTGVQLFRYDSALKDGATGLLSLPTFLLTPGSYTIAAVTGGDEYDFLPGSDFAGGTFGTGGPIAYGEDRYVSGNASTLQYPTESTGNNPGGFSGNGFFAPNFQFTTSAIAGAPEPSEWAALGFTAFGIGGLLLRARKRRAAGPDPAAPDAARV